MPARRKIPRDPDAPQKPSSAFFFYLKEQQWVVRAEMRDQNPDLVSIPNSLVAKECGKRWGQMDEHTKSKYMRQQQLAKSVYDEKFRKYLAEKESKKAVAQPQPVRLIPKTHEDYFNFLESSWRKTSMSMPGLSPLEIQNRLWELWQLQAVEENPPPQDPIQCCEVNWGPDESNDEQRDATEPDTNSFKTAFEFFVMSIFQNTKSKVSEEKLLKLCEEKWKYMNDEEKETFVEMEAHEKERLRTERMTAVREDEEESEVELSDEEMAELTMQAHHCSDEESV